MSGPTEDYEDALVALRGLLSDSAPALAALDALTAATDELLDDARSTSAAGSLEQLMSGVAALLDLGRIAFRHHPNSALPEACWSVEATRWPDDEPGVQRWEGFGPSLTAALAKLLATAP